MLVIRIIQLIISVQIDLDIIHKTTGRDLRPLLQLSPVEDKPSITTDKNHDESQATAGKPELTRKQRVSLLMHILGEAGIFISEKNGDGGISKTKMACLMNMILDGRTSIPAKNTSTPKDLSTVIDNPERYNDVLVSALENAGLTALAAKIRG